MTVPTDVVKVTMPGNASATVFSGNPLKIFDVDDLLVTFVDAAGNETVRTRGTGPTNYSVTLASETQLPTLFTITYPADLSTPMAVDEKLVTKTDLSSTQDVNLRNQGGYFADVQEQMHDRAMIVINQGKEEVDRAIKVSIAEDTLVNLTLPNTGIVDGGNALLLSADKTSLEFGSLSGTLPDPVTVARGGTGGTTPASGRSGLGATTVGDAVFIAADEAAGRTAISAQEDVITTRGDIVVGNATPAASRLALGAANEVLVSDGTDVTWDEPPLRLGKGGLVGCKTGPAADALHDVTTQPGYFRDNADTATFNLSSALTKQLDVAWAEGNNAGGFPTGASLPASGSLFFFLIAKTDGTVDAGWDTDASATNLLADATGYTLYRRLRQYTTDGSSNLVPTRQDGDRFTLDVPVQAFSAANPGTAAVLRALSGLPTGVKLKPILTAGITDTSTGSSIYGLITDPDTTGATPSAGVFNLKSGLGTASSLFLANGIDVLTDTSGQVRTQLSFSDAGITLEATLLGWQDDRGRFD